MDEQAMLKFKKFCSYVCRYRRYAKQFYEAMENKLYDFAIIILWKIFILFIYEKYHQIRKIKDDIFIEKWSSKFKTEKDKLENYPKENFYCFNKKKDEEMIEFLAIVYPLDANYVKKLISLNRDRCSAAHVCDWGLGFTEMQVVNYLHELSIITSKVEKLHNTFFIKDLDCISALIDIGPSKIELSLFLDGLIENLKNALTFSDAQKIESEIISLPQFIKPEQILKILDAVFQNGFPLPINQVLEASGGTATSRFLEKIFNLPQNKDVKTDEWKKLYDKLSKQQYFNVEMKKVLGLYNWLYQEIIKACETIAGGPDLRDKIKEIKKKKYETK